MGYGRIMAVRTWIEGWPVYRQLTGTDPLGRGAAAQSDRSTSLTARTESADSVARSVCPYCAVGCGQRIFVKDGAVIQIEGDPDSPVSRGRLCPKGSASLSLVTSDRRQQKVLYRRPYGMDWEELDLDTAMEMIAERVLTARAQTWQDTDDDGRPLHRTLGISSLGGATLDNEENYLIKKLFTAMGAIQIENQARI
ncbi:MAG: formate dehydrogenase major subunit [Actinoplanes sp.]|nr:formate dehydrogenase major subunit [Actinoplanes sp.]